MGASKPERAHTVYSEWGPVGLIGTTLCTVVGPGGLVGATLCTVMGTSRPKTGNTVYSDGASRPGGAVPNGDGGQEASSKDHRRANISNNGGQKLPGIGLVGLGKSTLCTVNGGQ